MRTNNCEVYTTTKISPICAAALTITPARNTSLCQPGVHVSHPARGPLTQGPQLATLISPAYNSP